MKTALLCVDLQQDYFPGGRMELAGAVEAARLAARLQDFCRGEGLPLIHMQHLMIREGATFFLPGTDGIRFFEASQPLPGETVLQKHFPNSFRETGLAELLRERGVQRLLIAGMMSHMCIDATVRAAFDMGFQCLLAHDACATRDLEFRGTIIPAAKVHGAFMAALAVVYARVLSVAELIESLES